MTLRSFDGRAPALETGAWVDPAALVIGDVVLGPDASIWPMCVLRGDVNRIRVGARTNIQDGSVLHVNQPQPDRPAGDPLTIAEDVTVGHGVVLHGCTLEARCLIGMGSVVLDGAVVRSGTLLAAGSLVSPGKVLEGGLWAGRPARLVRALTAAELERIALSAQHYARLKDRYVAALAQ